MLCSTDAYVDAALFDGAKVWVNCLSVIWLANTPFQYVHVFLYALVVITDLSNLLIDNLCVLYIN